MLFLHADIFQCSRCSYPLREVVKACGSTLGTYGMGHLFHHSWESWLIEGDDMRKDDRMHLGMGKIVSTTEDVADFVVETRTGCGQGYTRQVGTVENFAASL